MEVLTLVYSFILIAITVLLYSKWKYSYWKDRNVFHVEPTFFYGHLKDVFRKDQQFAEFLKDQYDVAKSKGIDYFGVYKFWNPFFVPVNLELIKRVIHTDYSYFASHGTGLRKESDVLSGHLFHLEGEEWKSMRTKLTPTFTSGKMKMMFQTMTHCAIGMENMLRSSVKKNEAIEIKDILSRFTIDIIGNVVFGIDIDSMINPDNEFIRYGTTTFKLSPQKRILLGLQLLFPSWLTSIIGTNGHDTNKQMFFFNLVKNTVKYREENNILRKDFMHLLIQLKNLGRITEEDGTILEKDGNSKQGLTLNQITAQAYVFFSAGFETSATTMTFVLLELAQNQAIQDRLRKEIQTVLNKDNNKFTYESITGMEYLEMVVSETLRKHPPLPTLVRACTKRYTVPNSNLVIEPGVRVDVPLFAIHRDPEFYPDPDKFDPERFSEENKATRSPFTYFPFGEGPRTCIGSAAQSEPDIIFLRQAFEETSNRPRSKRQRENYITDIKQPGPCLSSLAVTDQNIRISDDSHPQPPSSSSPDTDPAIPGPLTPLQSTSTNELHRSVTSCSDFVTNDIGHYIGKSIDEHTKMSLLERPWFPPENYIKMQLRLRKTSL